MFRQMKNQIKSENTPSEPQEGVEAVRRAMNILRAFGMEDAQLSLAELSRRTGYHRSTVLRLARTLAMDDYLAQRADGTWRLARAAGWLGACYQATFNVHDVVEPVLRELSDRKSKRLNSSHSCAT